MTGDCTGYTLIGRNASPFTRRVAIMMALMGLGVERVRLSPLTQPDAITPWNPVGRVPVLVLPDGERLVESAAILDHLLELHDSAGRFLAKSGPERRQALQMIAHAQTAMEKIILAAYEHIKRPEHLRHPALREAYIAQARSAFGMLEARLSPADSQLDKPDLATVTAAVAHGFAQRFLPAVLDDLPLPVLSGITQACAAHPAFTDNQPETP